MINKNEINQRDELVHELTDDSIDDILAGIDDTIEEEVDPTNFVGDIDELSYFDVKEYFYSSMAAVEDAEKRLYNLSQKKLKLMNKMSKVNEKIQYEKEQIKKLRDIEYYMELKNKQKRRYDIIAQFIGNCKQFTEEVTNKEAFVVDVDTYDDDIGLLVTYRASLASKVNVFVSGEILNCPYDFILKILGYTVISIFDPENEKEYEKELKMDTKFNEIEDDYFKGYSEASFAFGLQVEEKRGSIRVLVW
jgi:hypothetical protein